MTYSKEYKATVRGRAVSLMGNARQRCKDKGVELHITLEWVEDHVRRGTCEITGMPFNLEPPPDGLTRRFDAPSLDRKDKNKPYTEENTRVILWAVNCALAEYGTEAMLPILEAMVKGIKDAETKPITSVSDGDNREGKIYPESGTIPTTWLGKNYYDTYHHCGADARKDSDNSTEEGS